MTKRPAPAKLIVRETRTGRFHLSNFGVTTGGSDRTQPFIIIVQDARGHVIAESDVVTAASLGIADRGREDYDCDKFRQRDFFVRDPHNTVKPASPIARRVPWKII